MGWWPLVYDWIGAQVKAHRVDGDAQWLQSRGRWHDGFVVLDVPTALPVLAALLPSRRQWACRGVGRQLRQRTHGPQGLITDG